MFQTLKARRKTSGDSEYVVHSANPPFEKTKKQPACTQCKLKKLRCVAEADSCVRCIKQGLECSYHDISATGRRATSSASRASTASTADSEPESQSSQSISIQSKTVESSMNSSPPVLGDGEPGFPDGFLFPDILENDDYLNFSELTQDCIYVDTTYTHMTVEQGGDYNCSHFEPTFAILQDMDFAHNSILGFPDSGNQSIEEATSSAPAVLPYNTSSFLIDSSGWEPNLVQESPASHSTQSPAMTPGIDFPLPRTSGADFCVPNFPQELPTACRCLDRIMGANKTMQVKLVWRGSSAEGPTVSIDHMLQCQKDVLTSCETLLECIQCSLRLDYVMLIISMCREMMNGIGDLDAMTMPRSQYQSSKKRPRSEASGNKLNSTKGGLRVGGWRLDDEDEMQIMRRLIGIRITRLGSLVRQLEKTVNAHHSAYGWIVRALSLSINEKIDAIGSDRDGADLSFSS